jgi:hypothetical protein
VNELDRLRRCGVAVRDVDQLKRADVKPVFASDSAGFT